MAVVMRMEWPEVTAEQYDEAREVVGWERDAPQGAIFHTAFFDEGGFKVVLSAKVPSLVTEHVRADVDAFLESQGLRRADIRHWIAHTGGPKVLQSFESALQLPPEALRRSWDSLRRTGNLSSASVLFVLSELLAANEARPGDLGMLMAMGPGFCAELVLLRW